MRPTKGREGARAFYVASFAAIGHGTQKTLKRLYGENFVVDDCVWTGVASGNPLGLEGRGRPLEFRLLHIFEFGDSGESHRENVWMDVAAILQQLPQALQHRLQRVAQFGWGRCLLGRSAVSESGHRPAQIHRVVHVASLPSRLCG